MSIKLKQIIIIVIVLVVSALLAVGIASGEQEYMNYLAQIFGGSSETYPPPYPPPPVVLPQIAVTCTGEILPIHKTATPKPVEPPTREPTNEPPPARSTATDDGRSGRDYPTPRWTPFETPVKVTP